MEGIGGVFHGSYSRGFGFQHFKLQFASVACLLINVDQSFPIILIKQ